MILGDDAIDLSEHSLALGHQLHHLVPVMNPFVQPHKKLLTTSNALEHEVKCIGRSVRLIRRGH